MKTRRSISFHIRRSGSRFFSDEGGYQGDVSSETLIEYCNPPDDYTVTYTLAPKTGKFDVRTSGFIRVGPVGNDYDWQVCQLPDWWVGKRVNRRVVETKSKRGKK